MRSNIKLSFAQSSKLSDCASFEIKQEESQILFGGFHEYVPPIYDEKTTKVSSQKNDTLFPSILNNNDNEKAKEI